MRKLPSLLAVAIACLWASASTAQAGTLSTDGQTVRYVAAPGEVNQVRFTTAFQEFVGADSVALTDSGAPVTPVGPGCFRQDIGSGVYYHCNGITPQTRLVVDLGDRNDFAYMGGNPFAQVELNGGPGDDRLGGAQTADILRGGEGDDIMFGDEFYLDFQTSTSYSVHSADDFSGGPGNDLVSYYNHEPTSVITATLDGAANDGEPGENDLIETDVESLEGARGIAANLTGDEGPNGLYGTTNNDTLVGNGGNDRLVGYDGSDTLTGGAGDDSLEGGADNDTLDGGPGVDQFSGDLSGGSNQTITGNDTIKAVDGLAEDISCGPGADTADVDAVDRVVTDANNACETLNRTGSPPAAGPGTNPPPNPMSGPVAALIVKASSRQKQSRGIRASVSCPGACRVTSRVTVSKSLAKKLRLKSTTLGIASSSRLKAGTASVAVKLSKKVRVRLRRVKRVAVTVALKLTDAQGASRTGTAKVTLTR